MALFRLVPTLGYMGAIYWLSSLPGDGDPAQDSLAGFIAWTPPALQNLLHMPLFGLLAWLWWRSLRGWVERSRELLLTAFLLTVCYGILDEWHQYYIPGRYASLTDMLLNAAGALISVWFIHRFGRTEHAPVAR